MFKSDTRVVSKSNNVSQRHGYRGGLPKARVRASDSLVCSPRLKSFPAEEIKRIDPPPIQNSLENMPPRQVINSGQGDSPPYFQSPEMPRSLETPKGNSTSPSEPRITQNICPMENRVNRSEPMIPSGRMVANSAIDPPPHRPFVPNICQADATVVNNSPRKMIANVSHGSETYRTNVARSLREKTTVPGSEVIADTLLPKDSNLMNSRQPGDGSIPYFAQQIPPVSRSDTSHYYNVDNNNLQMVEKRQSFETNAGMTSPQDIAINQIKNYQRSSQLGHCDYRQSHPNRIQHNQSHPVNNVTIGHNANFPQYCSYPTNSMALDQRSNLQAYPQGPVQQQSHHRQEAYPQTSRQPSNTVTSNINPDKKNELLLSRDPNQYGSSMGNAKFQQQSIHQPNGISSNVPQRESNHEQSENSRNINAKKQPLKFTAAMIRDQEMLIATMRQQGINEDIMRRQFDALLTEQKKQLLYLQQLQNPENNEKKLPHSVRVRRKISKIEEDGKPEWMLHITPPRIPYSVVEKIQAVLHADSRDMNSENQQGNHKSQICKRNPQEYLQRPEQMAVYNPRQQQSQYPHLSSNIVAAHKENQAYFSGGITPSQYQGYNYPIYYQQQPEKLMNNLPASPDHCQIRENFTENKQHYEGTEKEGKIIEPSSALKLRIYKNVIKRQKQNNGLQDTETIKEAMQALKNPLNQRGLEYLENLNKNRSKLVSLNGVQDPSEMVATSQQLWYNCSQPLTKGPSANGLENSRNPNNSLPRAILRDRNNDENYLSEYPRQRRNTYSRDCRHLTAERENGTTAMEKHQQNYISHGKPDGRTIYSNNSQGRFDHANLTYPGYVQPNIGSGDNNYANGCTVSTSRKVAQNLQTVSQCSHRDGMNPQSRFFTNKIPPNNQQQECFDPLKNNDIYEPVMIGAIQFFARKPEHFRKDISPHYCSTSNAKVFNPMLTCH